MSVDINYWQLAYDNVTLDFGTLDTGMPLRVQANYTPGQTTNQDRAFDRSDGRTFGVDTVEGGQWAFDIGVFHTNGLDRVGRASDALSAFCAAWSARSLRTRRGAVATLTNVARGLTYYGRPRDAVPNRDNIRHGIGSATAVFVCNSDLAYGPVESELYTTNATSLGGVVAPVTAPVTVSGSGGRQEWFTVGGNEVAPLTLVFTGGSTAQSATFLDSSGATVADIRIVGGIAYDETIVADARPWNRGVLLNNATPANGRLRGTPLSQLQLPPGDYEVRYRVQGADGFPSLRVGWSPTTAIL